MRLKLNRLTYTETSTIGELLIDDVFECYTLEDRVRKGPKVYAKTAISEGTYEVIFSFSQRFKKSLPLLLNVPQFEGVRIHPGNTAEDTEGCILVGKEKGVNVVRKSKEAYVALEKKLLAASAKEKILLDVKNIGRVPVEKKVA